MRVGATGEALPSLGSVCHPDFYTLLSQAACAAYCDPWTVETIDMDSLPGACYTINNRCMFNTALGLQEGDMDAGWQAICFPAPTPAPSPAPTPIPPTAAPTKSHLTVGGDPVFKINGYIVKFDLPLNVDTLLLSGHGIEVFGRADLTTPDGKNQWFSTVTILKDQFMNARIERKALRASHLEHQAFKSLSFVLTNANGRTMTISNPGEHSGGEFTLRHAGTLGGHIPREVVTVKLRGFEFAVGAQIAKKFKEKELQFNYAHLDFDLHDLRPAEKGLFAELFGIIPMSKNTAHLIRTVHK